jgi:hypothetical protein
MPERRRSPLVRAAGWTLLAGWAPLLLYVVFDALRGGGGNPIGLGLLMIASTLVAGVLLFVDVVRTGARARRARKERPPAA